MTDPRPMKMWATVDSIGHYSTIEHTELEAIRAQERKAPDGWNWERYLQMGWTVQPVTVIPGHESIQERKPGGGKVFE